MERCQTYRRRTTPRGSVTHRIHMEFLHKHTQQHIMATHKALHNRRECSIRHIWTKQDIPCNTVRCSSSSRGHRCTRRRLKPSRTACTPTMALRVPFSSVDSKVRSSRSSSQPNTLTKRRSKSRLSGPGIYTTRYAFSTRLGSRFRKTWIPSR